MRTLEHGCDIGSHQRVWMEYMKKHFFITNLLDNYVQICNTSNINLNSDRINYIDDDL